jgi:hypothetical protein
MQGHTGTAQAGILRGKLPMEKLVLAAASKLRQRQTSPETQCKI